jgi:hypothetical protein
MPASQLAFPNKYGVVLTPVRKIATTIPTNKTSARRTSHVARRTSHVI